MANLEKQDLEQILDKIFEQLKEKNFLPPGTEKNKEQVIEGVLNNLEGKISLDDLKSPNLYKALSISLISESVGLKYPKEKDKIFDYTLLFSDQENADRDQLNQEIQLQIKNLFTTLNQLNPNSKLDSKKIDELAEKLAQQITQRFMNEPGENKLLNTPDLATLIAEFYIRALFGGDDPKQTGEIPWVLQGPMVANYLGMPTPQAVSYSDTSVMGDQSRYDPGKSDPLGIEAMAFLNIMSLGLADEFGANFGSHPSPFKKSPNIQ